jgi:hypothetical protein
MKSFFGMLFGAAIMVGMGSSGAVAQTAEPTYKGDPSVYKVIFEDDNFRVIAATRKKGVHDKVHGHPVPYVTYNVTDCKPSYTPPMARQPNVKEKLEQPNPV